MWKKKFPEVYMCRFVDSNINFPQCMHPISREWGRPSNPAFVSLQSMRCTKGFRHKMLLFICIKTRYNQEQAYKEPRGVLVLVFKVVVDRSTCWYRLSNETSLGGVFIGNFTVEKSRMLWCNVPDNWRHKKYLLYINKSKKQLASHFKSTNSPKTAITLCPKEASINGTMG